MNPELAIEFGQEAVWTGLSLAAPFLIVGVIVAIVVGILQSMTHVQDQTVSFVPKIFLLAVTAIFCMSWCTERLVDYSKFLYAKPRLLNQKFVNSDQDNSENPEARLTERLASADKP